jgi:hypothetical protein
VTETQSALDTECSAIRAKIPSMSSNRPGKLIWQCESMISIDNDFYDLGVFKKRASSARRLLSG